MPGTATCSILFLTFSGTFFSFFKMFSVLVIFNPHSYIQKILQFFHLFFLFSFSQSVSSSTPPPLVFSLLFTFLTFPSHLSPHLFLLTSFSPPLTNHTTYFSPLFYHRLFDVLRLLDDDQATSCAVCFSSRTLSLHYYTYSYDTLVDLEEECTCIYTRGVYGP